MIHVRGLLLGRDTAEHRARPEPPRAGGLRAVRRLDHRLLPGARPYGRELHPQRPRLVLHRRLAAELLRPRGRLGLLGHRPPRGVVAPQRARRRGGAAQLQAPPDHREGVLRRRGAHGHQLDRARHLGRRRGLGTGRRRGPVQDHRPVLGLRRGGGRRPQPQLRRGARGAP